MRLRDATDASIAHLHPDDAVSRAGDSHDWSLFLLGAARIFGPRQRGFDGVEAGSLPSGGLSSSAAFSLALLSALADVNGRVWERPALAEVAMRVENECVGVNCGLLDPTIIVNARPDTWSPSTARRTKRSPWSPGPMWRSWPSTRASPPTGGNRLQQPHR